MASWRTAVVVGVGVVALTTGAIDAVAPRTPEETDRARQQQQVEQLADADEQSKERARLAGEDAARAEHERRLVPGEHPRVRVRLP